MRRVAIVDSGPLFAVANRRDPHHLACLALLRSRDFLPVIPALCVAEVAFLLGKRVGPSAEAKFVAGLESFEVPAPAPEDWRRIAKLVETYRDLPLGAADASVVVLAERFETDLVFTLDRRHFSAVRPQHVKSFELRPL